MNTEGFFNYKQLFEKQKVIIERIKNDITMLEKIQKDYETQKAYIEDYEHDESTLNDSESYSENDDESINFDDSNISDNLRLALGLEKKSHLHDDLSWTPPAKSGLDNSQPLIKNNKK